MAATESLSSSPLHQLVTSLAATTKAISDNERFACSPPDGISLLDTKAELLLSYIHNLVFLILIKLRHSPIEEFGDDSPAVQNLEKLTELRVFLEKGVRPLERRLQYQIDKVFRAAEEIEKASTQKSPGTAETVSSRPRGTPLGPALDQLDPPGPGSSHVSPNLAHPDELSYRPNFAALLGHAQPTGGSIGVETSAQTSASDDVYKPPRITPTSMPDLQRSDHSAPNRRSRLLDEYIDAELSSAPQTQPSIGSNSTILGRGRHAPSARDRDKERERTEYEETNLTRLPAESKAERRKLRQQGDYRRRDVFGGEDWAELGRLGDHVSRSTMKAGDSKVSILDRRKKRRLESLEWSQASETNIGQKFEKRRQVLHSRMERRDRGTRK